MARDGTVDAAREEEEEDFSKSSKGMVEEGTQYNYPPVLATMALLAREP
jgi:hypothetical protein